MSKIKIVQKDDPVLRKTAKEVPEKLIGSKKINKIIERMKTALHGEDDGVAIAAPQIGESLRIFVVKGEALAIAQRKQRTPADKNKEIADLVFINPKITRASKKKKKVEEGCLSVRWLYGKVERSEKVFIKAFDENGKTIERGASGLLAQIFQHEVDHLNGILFTDTATGVRDLPPEEKKLVKFVFFGSSKFSEYVLEGLELSGYSPALKIISARDPLPMEELKKLKADVFIVASFGKILPEELIYMPKYQTLNVHPSLLPELRGASPIQNMILDHGEPGLTIIRMDEKMDHGPILVQAKVNITPWPDHYSIAEEKLGRIGGELLAMLLPRWIDQEIKERAQDDSSATYARLIKKEDGLLDLKDSAETNYRKVLAYSTWPRAYMFFTNKNGKEIRIMVKDAKIEDGKFIPTRVVPAGKREMSWEEFLRGNA